MGALEIRDELHKFVDIGDPQFLEVMYKAAKNYMEQKRKDRMIAEGEEDIKAGRTHSLKEARKIIDNWEIK
ncbi:hypothetical protein [Aquimarina muelleri]|nr:hypothetical protein [Aquimarina muelleri]